MFPKPTNRRPGRKNNPQARSDLSTRDLNPRQTGFYLRMNDRAKLELVRNLVKSKVMEVQPFAGEEMSLPQSDPHRDGFVNGERTLASQILNLIDDREIGAELVEEEMILGR